MVGGFLSCGDSEDSILFCLNFEFLEGNLNFFWGVIWYCVGEIVILKFFGFCYGFVWKFECGFGDLVGICIFGVGFLMVCVGFIFGFL